MLASYLENEGETMGQARKSTLVVVAVALALALAAMLTGCSVNLSCGTEEETTTTAVPTTTGGAETTTSGSAPVPTAVPPADTSTTAAPSGTTTTEALSSAEERLPNGNIRAMGFIRQVWQEDGVRHISIDYAEFLTGEEANAAAVEAGEIAPGEDVPNDYFIRNVNTQLREFIVSDSVTITTSTRWEPHDGMGAPCTWGAFLSFWGSMGPLPEGDTHLKDMPWWIVRDGDTVVTIDEQYIP
jgi:hypothetical protein